MPRLSDLSLGHRLTLVTTLTTGFALLVAGAGMLVFEAAHGYRQAARELSSIAEMIGTPGVAALALSDRTAAQETLDALRKKPEIVCAGLYDARSRPFAGYCYTGTAAALPASPGADGLTLDGRSLILVRPVLRDGDRSGTVHVRASLEPLTASLRGYGLTVLLMAVAAMASAVPIARRLQRSVSRPILQLAEAAQAVTRDGNYALRVPRLGTDELGMLTEDFNTMLARIENQDAELRRARDELGLWLAAQGEDLRHETNERRRAEELSQRLMLAVQCSREMISITDLDDRLVFVNRAFLESYGLSEQEVIGRRVELIYSPNNAPELRNTIAEETLRGGFQGELLNRRKDGTEFPISLGTSVVRDDQGKVVGLLGVARDISEQKARETRLRLQEAALAATVDAVVITDRGGTIEWLNPAFTRLTGYSPEEAIGQNPRILKSGAHSAAFYAEIWETLLAGRVWYGELSNRRKDGSLYTEEMTITPVTDESGQIAHFAAIKRDITERIRLENSLHGARRMEALGQLAGGVAHDFNNLLGVIRGYGELLVGQTPAPDPRREKLEQILEASQRAANLTRQLLAFGRQQVLAPRVVDLNAVVAETERLVERLMGEDVEVVVALGVDLGRVRVDPSQIDQVLLNLAANARDAMPNGGRLTIETANVEVGEAEARGHAGARAGSFVRLCVSDNGVGMDERTRSRIFEPFFTTKEVGSGTGLGLASVYGIVKQSGGYVRVDSALGRGARFEIHLPRVEEALEAVAAAPAPPPQRTPATILLVEDEASLREIAQELLEASGYTVLAAANGAEALALAEQANGSIQLLLTDVVMPVMNGPTLAQRMRERWPDLSVVFMSGYSQDAVQKQGLLEAGARLLAKPFSLNTLVRSVEESLA